MRRSNGMRSLAALTCAAILVAACGSNDDDDDAGGAQSTETSGATSATSGATEAPGTTGAPDETDGGDGGASGRDTLRVVQALAPASMNPNIDKTRANVRIQQQIIESASTYRYVDGDYVLEPTLVTEWEQTAPKEWTFTVRPDVEFSNGEPLTAEAFRFSLERILGYEPGGKLAFFFTDWQIEVVDDMTFKVISALEDDTAVPGLMAQFYVFPPAYFAEVGDVAYGEEPIGTGPYVMTDFQPGASVSMAANENYWGVQPSIPNLEFTAVPDDSTRVSLLLAGQADIVDAVARPLVESVATSDDYEIRSTPTGSTIFLMINANLPPLDDVRVRQALNYAIDRELLVEGVFGDTAVPSYQWYVPVYPGFDPEYIPYPYDPDKARELMAEAGYPDGVDVDFYFPIGANPLDKTSAEAVQGQLQEAGFRVTMHGGEGTPLRNTFTEGQQSGFFMNNYGPPSLDVVALFSYYLRPGSNYSKTAASPEATAIVDEAARTLDEPERLDLYNQAQDVFLTDQALFVPLWIQVDTWGVANDLDFEPDPLQQFFLNEVSSS